MASIVTSSNIVADAYQYAFINLERMNYVQAEKLLTFVESNDYPIDQDMVDYAKVIIYSNTHRVDTALKISERMLSRGVGTPELEAIVRDVHNQLLRQNKFEQGRKEKLDRVTIDQVYEMIELIKPSDSKIPLFIELICNNIEQENSFLEFIDQGKFSDEDSEFVTKLKMNFAKFKFVEDTYETLILSPEDNKQPLYSILSKTILNTPVDNNLLLYLYMHKTGFTKKLLNDEGFEPRVRSMLAYSLNELFIVGLIGRINVSIHIAGEEYTESIKGLSETYMKTYMDAMGELEHLFESGSLSAELISELIIDFNRTACLTYPVVNPTKMDSRTFISAFLYVISNNNYQSEINAIIEDVYNFKQEDLKQEIEMLKILILI